MASAGGPPVAPRQRVRFDSRLELKQRWALQTVGCGRFSRCGFGVLVMALTWALEQAGRLLYELSDEGHPEENPAGYGS